MIPCVIPCSTSLTLWEGGRSLLQLFPHLRVLCHAGVAIQGLGWGLSPREVPCLSPPQWKDPFELSDLPFPLSQQTVDDEAMAA